MNPNSNSMNPDVVKTSLDKVFFQQFNLEQHPGVVTAQTSDIFKQDMATNSAVNTAINAGSGFWKQRQEEEDVFQDRMRVGNTRAFSVVDFDNSLRISKRFFDDAMFGTVEKNVSHFGKMASRTQDSGAFGIYRGAFTTTLTNDGAALCSASHVLLSGETNVSNLVSGALSATTLNTAITRLLEQKDQNGVVMGLMPKVLLVPPALWKLAREITGSETLVGQDNPNVLNVFSTDYGIYVATSPYLGAISGGSDTAWFLLADDHSVTRWVREDVWTDLVDYKFQSNNDYIYKGGFREVVGVPSHVGIVGSTGL